MQHLAAEEQDASGEDQNELKGEWILDLNSSGGQKHNLDVCIIGVLTCLQHQLHLQFDVRQIF